MTATRNDDTERREGSRVLSGFLMFLGICALGISMWMNFRFGWGLSQDLADRTTLAALHVLVDPAAAGLVLAGAMMRRWGWKWEGFAFQCIALVLILYSMLSVYGFMSARIAMVQSHDAVVKMQMGQLDWANRTSINQYIPKAERKMLRADAKDLAKEIRSSIAIIPDQQAASIAAALSVPVDKVQRALVMISSGTAQTLKFVCLLCGVMVWPRRKDDKTRTTKASGGNADSEYSKPHLVHNAEPVVAAAPQVSVVATTAPPPPPSVPLDNQRSASSVPPAGRKPKMGRDALHDFLRNSASGLSQQAIAAETGYCQQWISRTQQRLREQEERKASRIVAASRNRRQPTPGYQGIGGAYHAPACI